MYRYTENSNLRLLAANGNRKRISLVGKRYRTQQLLVQQLCPSTLYTHSLFEAYESGDQGLLFLNVTRRDVMSLL